MPPLKRLVVVVVGSLGLGFALIGICTMWVLMTPIGPQPAHRYMVFAGGTQVPYIAERVFGDAGGCSNFSNVGRVTMRICPSHTVLELPPMNAADVPVLPKNATTVAEGK